MARRAVTARKENEKRLAALSKVAARFTGLRPAVEALVNVRAVPTIFPSLDRELGVGGYPLERFALLHGPSSHGKTSLALGLMRSFLALDHYAIMIDAERCYDAETEVLTRRGFVRWPEVLPDDLIGCWDDKQESLVYERPIELTRQRYKGPMYRVDHGGVDLLVTPKHKMFVQTQTDTGRGEDREIGWTSWKLVPADELGDRVNVRYLKCAPRVVAPDIDFGGSDSNVPTFPSHDDRRALLRMIGFFIGDGWVGRSRGRANAIAFGLTKPRKVAYLREVAMELGWPVDEMANRVYVVRAEGVGKLFRREFYDDNGEKRIPEYLLDLNSDDAMALLDGLRASDGSIRRSAWEYFTTSEQVAQAVQRLVLHAGGAAHIHGNDTMIRVMVLSRMLRPIVNSGVRGKNTSIQPYDGDIFCAHTRTGVMVVRRNGKPVLSGNTTPFSWVEQMLGSHARHPGFLAKRPDTYEQTRSEIRTALLEIAGAKADGLLPEDTSAIIVVDSLKKLVPKKLWDEILKSKDADIGKRIGQIKAAMNSAWLDELVPLLEKSHATMVAIAREMENTESNPFAPDYKVGGGKDVFFDSSLAMRVERAGWVQDGEGDSRKVYGERHRVTVYKTKIAGKEDKTIRAFFHTSNGVLVPKGFDRARDVLELGEQCGVVDLKGARLYFEGELFANGRHNAVKALHANVQLLESIEVACRATFGTST